MLRNLLYSRVDYSGVSLHLEGGHTHYVNFNNLSGKLVQRKKNAVITTVTHTGIYLGQDSDGTNWIIHNHPKHGQACIVTEKEFSQKQSISLVPEACINPPNVVIARGLEHVKRKTPYRLLDSNCQHLTSDACNNKPVSQDLKRVSNAAKDVVEGVAIGATVVGGAALVFLLLDELFGGSRRA